jgi:hypothetical protein
MATSRRPRWPWLLAAALLFALAAWLMAGTDVEHVGVPDKVSLPRRMTRADWDRAEKRKSMPEEVVVPGAPEKPARPRDPVLALMPATVKKGAVVFEANAIRHSDLGDLMIDCMFTGENDTLGRMRDAGFDPLNNLDRLAVIDDTLVMTGDFAHTDFPSLLNAQEDRKQFGKNTELFSRNYGDGGLEQQLGLWSQQVLVMGENPVDVKDVIDRLDGKGDPDEKHVLGQSDSYGEMYGVMKMAQLASTGMRDSNPELANLLEESAGTIRLHADVTHDVGLVADIEGSDPAKTQDLRKAFGTALTLAKLQAEAKGNKNAAEVLGFARVASAEGGNFRLEAGLPYEFLEKQLKECVAKKKERQAQREARRAAPTDAGIDED